MARDLTKTKLELEPHQIVLRPLVTEKGMHKANRYNAYAFEVNRLAGKDDIRRAVETIFQVKVESVRTAVFRGKPKRLGKSLGRRANWKKAYVKLRKGEKTIEYFEGV